MSFLQTDDAARGPEHEADYRHTQFGHVVFMALMLPIIVVIAVSASIGWHWITFAVLGVLAACVALFYSLSVEIRGDALRVWFGSGLIRKRFDLADIVDASIVRTRLINGWGIHTCRQGWLWNVSGFDAVHLTLVDGKGWVIGTDEPEALLAAVREYAALDEVVT